MQVIHFPSVMFARKWFMLYRVEKRRVYIFANLPVKIAKRNELLLFDVKCLTQLHAILMNALSTKFGSDHTAFKACVELTAKVTVVTCVMSQGAKRGNVPT